MHSLEVVMTCVPMLVDKAFPWFSVADAGSQIALPAGWDTPSPTLTWTAWPWWLVLVASRRRSPAISRSISAFRLSELASKRREHFDFDYEVPSFGDTRERRFNLAFNLESFTTRAGVCGGLDDITTKLPYIKSTIVQSNGEVMKEPNGRPK